MFCIVKMFVNSCVSVKKGKFALYVYRRNVATEWMRKMNGKLIISLGNKATENHCESKIGWFVLDAGKEKNLELDNEPWQGWNHSSKKMLDAMEASYGTLNSSWDRT